MPAPNVQSAAFRMPLSAAGHTPDAKRVSSVPASTDAALGLAMNREGVPQSWQPALRFHSARGLFQLTAANYHLNPNSARSYGNAVEEAQGGIRYV